MNQGPYQYGAFQRGGSTVSHNSRAMEAQLLSQATQTAMIAAKSILMSGGSEEVALKTAKAAAESILNPTGSDNDTISGRSSTFLRRRKMKRQAEVVASMALTQAANSIRNGQSADWSESHQGTGLNPYAGNITTRSMHTQDEPSVLTSSTSKPPKGPFGHHSVHSRTSASHMYVMGEQPNKACGIPPMGPPLSTRVSSLSKYTNTPGMKLTVGSSQTSTAQSEANNSVNKQGQPSPKNMKSHASERNAMPVDDPIYAVASVHQDGVPEQNMVETVSPSGDGEDFDDETTYDPDASVWAESRHNPWKDFDPLMTTFNNVLNMLTCGPVGSLSQSNGRSRRDVPRRIAHDNEFDTVNSAMDTVDDRDDAGTEFRSVDSYDRSEMKGGFGRSGSSGENSSVDSGSILRELHSTSASEGEILVRSSIRDTMEKIVSISRKGLKEDDPRDRKWLSYELTQNEGPEIANSNVKRKTIKAFITPMAGKKKGFFFGRRAGKKY